MVITLDIKDEVADKILYFLEHFKDDIKIEYKDSFMDDMQKYIKDIEKGNLEEIENVDKYIEDLSYEVN